MIVEIPFTSDSDNTYPHENLVVTVDDSDEVILDIAGDRLVGVNKNDFYTILKIIELKDNK